VLIFGKHTVLIAAAALFLVAVALSPQMTLADEMPEVTVRGVADPALRGMLEGLTPLLWQGAAGPSSELMLRSRAQEHRERLLQALASEGYYAGKVSFEVAWNADQSQAVFDIDSGPSYQLDRIEVAYHREPGGAVLSPPPVYVSPGLQQGAVGTAKAILDGEKQVIREATNAGFPFAKVHDRRVVVNHDVQTVNITYFLALGDVLTFGEARPAGLEEVRPERVLRELPWKQGETYRAGLLDKAQEALQRTGLFTVVRVMAAPPSEVQDGAIPILIEVTERQHRSISLGLQYRTDEGVGVGGRWEHRNFMGLGRRLRLSGNLTELEQSLATDYEIQQFRRSDQTLTLTAKAAQLDPDPYKSRRFDVGAWVERTLSPEWSIGIGPALRISRVEERRREEQYYLVSLPSQVSYDRRNDRTDATRGFNLVNRLTPFADVTNTSTYFLKNDLAFTHYLTFAGAPSITLATRVHLGVMGGAGLGDIPADERFYAGGGGSIRGYAYQEVGPLDRDGEATGGRSVTDWSVEIRKRINERFGVVAFVDGGMAHESVYPDFSDAIQWGAGIGVRYFTPIGPLRLDVATPVNRRKDLDSSIQFYISVGQAF
jgi:translocation and assembly module TamA